MFRSLQTVDGVKKVHNLRVWALTLDKVAVSAHLAIDSADNAQSILRESSMMLERTFGVYETTIQIELFNPDDDDCKACETRIMTDHEV